MEFRDYYATLGVDKSVAEPEIKKAYRRLARAHHPDLNAGDAKAEARFKEINEAYEVLGDPEKRRKYDELGANWKMYEQAGGPAGAHGPWGAPFGGGGPAGGGATYRTMTADEMQDVFGGQDPFSDFFHQFFSGGGPTPKPRARTRGRTRASGPRPAPPDADQPIELSLEDILLGASRRLVISSNGASRNIDVRIPPGVAEGARIRVAGGAAGEGDGAPGDLYLRVRVLPHAAFERRGHDLHARVGVPVTTAVLGGEVLVPSLSGSTLRLKIPEGTPGGRVFRLRGHGLPAVGSSERGDLFATVDLRLPGALSAEEREHYEALRALSEGTKS